MWLSPNCPVVGCCNSCKISDSLNCGVITVYTLPDLECKNLSLIFIKQLYPRKENGLIVNRYTKPKQTLWYRIKSTKQIEM